MSVEKVNILEIVKMKSKNKRIEIVLVEGIDKQKFFIVRSKTLVSFSDRKISETNNVYSVETFVALKEAFSFILGNSKIKNKTLLRDLSNMGRWTTSSTL